MLLLLVFSDEVVSMISTTRDATRRLLELVAWLLLVTPLMPPVELIARIFFSTWMTLADDDDDDVSMMSIR